MVSSISSSVSSWASTLFSQLDTSKKGYISESDLSSAFSALGSGSSDSSNSASKLFGTLDSNNDGKVTQDELANTLQNLSDQLNSQYDASRMASAMSGAMPPPPSDNASDDTGLTKDQLSSIASTTTDSNLASLMNNVASNFSAADTNGDGKVSAAEAMAYQQSTSSTGTSTASTTSSSTTSSDAGLTKEQLTSIASTTKDSNLASLMNSVASNFSAADTNGDGKVSQAEAMAYKESTESASSATSGNSDSQTLKHILELLQAYTTKQSTSNSSLSLSA